MFAPMAFTIAFALLGSLISALAFAPVLSSLLLKKGVQKEFVLVTFLKRLYKPVLQFALRWKLLVIIVTLAVFVFSISLVPRLGTEFIPTLEESSIQLNLAMAPSISLEKATETVMKLERRIKMFEEVDMTIAKIGRPEAGSHPHPVNSAHIQLMLKPIKGGKITVPRPSWSNRSTKHYQGTLVYSSIFLPTDTEYVRRTAIRCQNATGCQASVMTSMYLGLKQKRLKR